MAANYEMNKLTKKGWTKQPNAILRDKDLTSDAKVIIFFLLSITGDYNIGMKGISKATNLSESKVKRAVELLQDTGYLKIIKIRNGKYFGGYKWLISDVAGVYRKCADGISNDDISIPAISNYGISNDDISIYEKSMDAPLYEYTERYEHTNNQRRIDEHTEEDERPHHQPDVEEEAFSPSFKRTSSCESSSEAKASPLSSKTPTPSTQESGVISQQEFEFQQFLKKYPKKPYGTDLEDTKQAFFEATRFDGSFAEIMAGLDAWCNSVDWTKENGRYITKPLYFLTTRKWEEIPRTINTEIDPGILRFIKPRDVEDYI